MSAQKVPYSSIDTPAVLLDMGKLEANIKEMSQLVAEAGIKLRPHIKVHQCADIAKLQIEAGACGIEVGNIDQAKSMADGGLDDILIAHPFYSDQKLEKLKKFVNKPGLKLTIVVDMIEQAEGISQVGQAVGKKIPVLLKIDTGIKRYGVLPGDPTLDMAKKLKQLPGIEMAGIYGHESGAEPTAEGVSKMAFQVASLMCEAARMLRSEGIAIEHISVGASPTFHATCHHIKEGNFPEITEIHPGQCVIGDIMYMRSFGNTREACAITVLTTVVSTSHAEHVVIDAGYKTFGSDSLIGRRDSPDFFWNGMASFGSFQGRSDLWLGRLGAESAWVYYKEPEKKLILGERLEIVPNNATLVINIHEQIFAVRNGEIERVIPVTGRGRGS